MKKPILPSELREHRERHNLTSKQLAEIFNVPVKEYERIESGNVPPTPEEEKKYRNLLAQEKLGAPKPLKWYHSKAWRWVIPIVTCLVLILLMTQSKGFLAGMGLREGESIPMTGLVVASLVFCLCYWYFWTPELPFKRSGIRKNLNKNRQT